jgi:hypothetical protein
MSLSGVKRTWALALHMSAFDPKRTLCAASTLSVLDDKMPPLDSGAAMRRREFIGLLGSIAAWPIGLRAQQLPTMIGFLRPTKAEEGRTNADKDIFCAGK